ncbi:MAG: S1 RNA-binding domain-containing protein [Patescibacteria group bacterium]
MNTDKDIIIESAIGESEKKDKLSSLVDRDLLKPKHPMEALLKQRADGVLYLKVGDIVEGIFLERAGSRLFINLGPRGIAVVFGKEFYDAQHVIKNLKPGDTVTAKVVELESSIEKGYPELSLKEAGREKLWADLRDAMQKGTQLNLTVKEVNRGGILLEYSGVRGFLPVSHLSQKNYPRVENGDKEKIYEELKKFVGKELTVKILDINQQEEKLIFSEKELEDNSALRAAIAKHSVGEVLEGDVQAIAPFGAFVKLPDGIEGLIHVSELDWQLVENPKDIVSIGQKVHVKVIGIEGGKISLSLKALKEDPWMKLEEKVKKGDAIRGVVTKFNPFGAFVKTVFEGTDGVKREIQGLIHISEFGTEIKMKELLQLGKEHEFVVSFIELGEHRMSLILPEHAKAKDAEEEKK